MRPTSKVWLGIALGLLISLTCPAALRAAMSESAVDEAMTRGYSAIRAQDTEGAKSAFLSVLTEAPDSPRAAEAMLRLGHLQLRTDSAEACDTFESLVAKYPEAEEAVTAFYRLGSLNTRRYYYDDAQAAFRAAAQHQAASKLNQGRARLDAAFVEIMKFWAGEYWGRGKDGKIQMVRSDAADIKVQHLENARKEFEAIRDAFAKTTNPEIAAIADCAIGEIYLLGQTPHLAERAYWRAIRQYGTMPDALNTLARYGVAQAMHKQGKLEKVLEQYDLMLNNFASGKVHGFEAASPQLRANAYLWKVVTLHDLGRLDEALAVTRQAKAEIGPITDGKIRQASAKIELWEGSLLARVEQADEAVEILQSVIDKYPDTPQAIRAGLILSELRGGN